MPKKSNAVTRTSSGAAAEYVELASLKPWRRNPRRIEDAFVQQVAESIKAFGFAAPIIARRATREIVAGHVRYRAAQLLEIKRVPVRFVDLDERQSHLLALADNRLAELSQWDEAALSSLLADYTDVEAELAGWNEYEKKKLAESLEADSAQAPNDFASHDSGDKPTLTCPKCGFLIAIDDEAAVPRADDE